MTTVTDKTKFSLSYLLAGDGIKDWWKAWGTGWRLVVTILIVVLLLTGAVRVYSFIFPKAKQNVSQQRIIALPGSTIGAVDMKTIQVSVEEKTWEVGVGGGVLNYDSKNGAAAFGWVRKRF